MNKPTLITIGLLFLLIFAGCGDSTNISSPADGLTAAATEEAGTLEQQAQQTVSLQLEPIGGGIDWQLQADVTLSGNGQYSGGGKFTLSNISDTVFVVMQIEEDSSGEVAITLRVRSSNGGGQVRLNFGGTITCDPETHTMTGNGVVKGAVNNPLTGETLRLIGPSQITLGSVVGEGC